MARRCDSRQYVGAGFILHEHLPRSAANISAARLSASFPLSQPNYTGLFEYAAHNKPTQLPPLPISHKDTMLAQPTARSWGGPERKLFSSRWRLLLSHWGGLLFFCFYTHFLFRWLLRFAEWPSTVLLQQRQQPRAEISARRFVYFLSFVPVREPEGRARDPGRATEPPVLNQRDTRCVISHTNTHTHTDYQHTQRGGSILFAKAVFFFFFFFARKRNRGPKNCCNCGPTWFKASLPLNRPFGQLTNKTGLFKEPDTSLCVKVKEDKNKQQRVHLIIYTPSCVPHWIRPKVEKVAVSEELHSVDGRKSSSKSHPADS